MAQTKVGDIHVDITSDFSDVDRAGVQVPRILQRIEQRVGSSMSSLAASVKAAGAAFIAAFGASSLIGAMDALIDRQKQLKNAAEGLGVSVRDLSAYEYALKSVGINAEQTAGILRTLYQRMSDRDATSEGVRVFDALGISTRDASGGLKSLTEIMPQLSAKFAGMRDGVEKSRIAMQLFGDQGAALLPFLNKGPAGIAELTKRAEELGAVFDNETNQAAVRLGHTIDEMRARGGAFSSMVFKELIPSLQMYATAMRDAGGDTSQFQQVVSAVAMAIKGFMAIIDGAIATVVAKVQMTIGAFRALSAAITGDFAGAVEAFKKGWTDSDATLEAFTKRTMQSFGLIKEAGTLFKDEFNKVAPPVVKTAEEISKALEAIKKANQAALQDLMTDKRGNPAEKLGELETMVRRGAVTWREYVAAVREVKNEIGQGELNRVLDADTQPLMNKLAALEEAKRQGVIGWYEYARAVESVNKQGAQNMDDLVGAVGSSLTQIFKKSKAAAIASALINTYQGITKAIAQYPPPISYAMAGVQAALGFAQVAAIRSSNESGGGGGAAPTAGAAVPAAAPEQTGASMTQTLMVRGIDPKSLFTGDSVRSLAEQLLQYQRDGGRVILA